MTEPNEAKKKFREPKEIVVVKNTYDWQRMKLDRLMKNPEKLVQLPEKSRDKKSNEPPDFVRNVMGSSAGAGSGEFHVYRHIRRREYSRQKSIQLMSDRERKDEEFRLKMEHNQTSAEEKTAKKRAKRLKKKQMAKKLKKKANTSGKDDQSSSESSSEDDSDGEDVKSTAEGSKKISKTEVLPSAGKSDISDDKETQS